MPYFLSAKNLPLTAVLASIALFFAFGLFHLGKFETVDEHFWKYERIPQYWNALADGKWKKTYINDKPGISVALVSGIGLLFADPLEHRVRDTAATLDDRLTVYAAEKTEAIDIALRLPLLIANGLLILLIFCLVGRATGSPLIALFTALFTALSPILLGISQIINPDTLLWSLFAAAFFSYFAFLKTEEKKFLVITALAAGGALLSKYAGNILYPLLFAFLLGYTLVTADQMLTREALVARLRRHLLYFLAIIIGSFAVFAVLLPAVFAKPTLFWEGTLGFWHSMHILVPFALLYGIISIDIFCNRGRLTGIILRASRRCFIPLLRFSLIVPFLFFSAVVLFGLGDQSSIPLQELMQTAKTDGELVFPLLADAAPLSSFLQKLLVQAYPFVFSLPPIILFLVFFLWARILIRKKYPAGSLFSAALLSWFALAYFIAALAAGVLTNARYGIMLYPLFAFLAALGMHAVIALFPERRRIPVSVIGAVLAVIFLSIGLFHNKPFYFNYASPLLSKTFALHDGWGYGLYEAAEYLNALPEAEDAFVWSDRNGICQFLSGPRCISGYKIDLARTPPRYFVVSKRGVERGYVPRDKATGAVLVDYATIETNAVWRLDIGGRPGNFILIIPAAK